MMTVEQIEKKRGERDCRVYGIIVSIFVLFLLAVVLLSSPANAEEYEPWDALVGEYISPFWTQYLLLMGDQYECIHFEGWHTDWYLKPTECSDKTMEILREIFYYSVQNVEILRTAAGDTWDECFYIRSIYPYSVHLVDWKRGCSGLTTVLAVLQEMTENKILDWFDY